MIDIIEQNKQYWDNLRKKGLKKSAAPFPKDYDRWKTTNPQEEQYGKMDSKEEEVANEIIDAVTEIPIYKELLNKNQIPSITSVMHESPMSDDPGDFYFKYRNMIENLTINLQELYDQMDEATSHIHMTWDSINESYEPDPDELYDRMRDEEY